jgi:phage replication initiation protein
MHGYRRARRVGPLWVLYDGAVGMGVHVIASGEGCRYLEARSIGTAWTAFLQHVSTGSRSLSRLDVAIDDHRGVIATNGCIDAVQRGDAVTRWKKYRVMRSATMAGVDLGVTLYLGSASSDTQMRIYDKAAETGTEGPWTRVEMETRDERAQMLAGRLVDQGMTGAAAVVRSYLDFREGSRDARDRDRCRAVPWWGEFLGWVAAQPLGTEPAEPQTVERKVSALAAQYGPTMGVIAEVLGYAALVEVADAGRARWRESHRHLIRAG